MYLCEALAPLRRTQAQRSAATQQALVDAAIQLLMKRGWAATTMVAVCKRALVAHVGGRPPLPQPVGALGPCVGVAVRRFRSKPAGAGHDDGGVAEPLWRAVGDHRFKAVIEAWSAAGNDQELAAELGPAITRFAKLVSPANAGRTGPLRDPTQKRSC